MTKKTGLDKTQQIVKLISSLIALALAVVLLVIGIKARTSGNYNYQTFDTVYKYDYAIIMRADGEQRIELASWRDYEDGEQLQLTATDGTVYLVNSTYTILVKEPKGD